MAVLTSPRIATAPIEPSKGGSVLVLQLAPPHVIVYTRSPLPAPSGGGFSNLSGGQAV